MASAPGAVQGRLLSRIALLCSEPLRTRMAGIGIRYLELARRLPAFGIEVVLVHPAEPSGCGTPGAEAVGIETPCEQRPFERGRLAALTADCSGAVAQGQLANDLVLEVPDLPVAIDLYDPWLVENLHYYQTLGLDPWRNDHATWMLQLQRGDFFLCSSLEQRLYYLGLLTALGRVNPEIVAADPALVGLIDIAPFGVPDRLPAHQPYLDSDGQSASSSGEGRKRLLFGGLYDWYDPQTVLDALTLIDRPELELLFIRNPNSGATPQRRMAEVEQWARRRGWWGNRIRALDWIPYERRYDLLRDVELMVATHRPSLETDLALRTRFLDALVAGCPVVASEGGALARLLTENDAGWLVPPGDPEALASALSEVILGGDLVRARVDRARGVAEEFAWDRVLEPIVRFCRAPARDSFKERFASPLETHAPADSGAFRLRRFLRTRLGGG